MKRSVIVLIIILLLGSQVHAQDAVQVPDLTGMNVPQAASALNRVGFALGNETGEAWTATSGLEQNRIKSQSVSAGQTATSGSAVDVTVLRSPNVALVYDDNDLTLVNKTGGDLDLNSIIFNTLDGNPAQFAAARWAGSVKNGDCTQIWSVGRNGSKGLGECSAIQNWLITKSGAEHFWTGEGNSTHFAVTQNGIQRGQCAVANPGRCEFYIPGGASGDTTDYIYLAYGAHNAAVINQSTDRWMTLSGLVVYNNFAPQKGLTVPLGDMSLYTTKNPVARAGQLAPGQCVLFTDGSPDGSTPPQPCDVVARLDIGPTLIFWGAPFDLQGSSDQRHTCPAATAGNLTLCVMPR
ncbi:MAG: PASTA domain-containing protein [Anaerolineae bacterium]|nr:PASTA domain-containing protein [Anaerolineae bacterium]